VVGPAPEQWAVEPGAASAYELEPGLWRVRLPLGWPTIPHVNAYAIERADGWLLVDCGSAGDASCWDALVAALAQAGIEIGDVRMLVGTHAHSDHIGVAQRLIEESGCEFLLHPDTGHFYDVMRSPAAFEEARGRRATLEGVPPEVVHLYSDVGEEVEGMLAPVEPHRPLHTGERIESRLGDWHVVEAPGHAPSHVLLHQPERRLLIVGDVVSPRFAPYYDYGYSADPVGQFVASLALAEELDVDLALPGHGRPLEEFGVVVEAHRRGVEERLRATAAAVEAGPAGAYEITRRVFGDEATEFLRVWQFVEVVCYLRHLRVGGLVSRDAAGDESFSYRSRPW
jgi:glyoxylase-like metal-dependent hydrolase (beta-lactamase superfamily II)